MLLIVLRTNAGPSFDSGDLTIESVEVNGILTNVNQSSDIITCMQFQLIIKHRFQQFKLDEKHPVMGSALHIPLETAVSAGSTVKVYIVYQTSKDSIALQWLEKE